MESSLVEKARILYVYIYEKALSIQFKPKDLK